MKGSYDIKHDGSFVIENFSQTKPFANFFPGVAGLYGIPMWVFYVNRGQGIASFGIESKDKALLEFQPANKAYRNTSIHGFRTFIKVGAGKKPLFYEPFLDSPNRGYNTTSKMTITSHDLTIEETNVSLGVAITVNYFTIAHEPFAGLVRRVTLTNIGKKKLALEMIDGLPVMNPYGLGDWLSKHMSRTVEAWMSVLNVESKAPFYQLKVVVADTPQVTYIKEGNFYVAIDESSQRLLPVIVENALVFGQATDLLFPQAFLASQNFIVPQRQETDNRTPSAMSLSAFELKPGHSKTLTSVSGFVHDLPELKDLVKKVIKPGFIEAKAKANQQLIESIKDYCFTQSSLKVFDQYCGQTFLDNILRGGLPISLPTAQGPAVFNVYSRKHGDLERDYNFFTLSPTFLSQGNGNYRDVNQNRRNDVFFNPDLKDSAVVAFMNLIQADGYNPLVVKGTTFAVDDEYKAKKIIVHAGIGKEADQILQMLLKGFMPGDLLKRVSYGVSMRIQPQNFLMNVLAISRKQEAADPGEGFWTDHWTYNLDLIESYLNIYPEALKELLVDQKDFYFFYSDFYTLPRDQRYVITDRGVRQYHSLEEHDKNTQAASKGYKLRVNQGSGDVYYTNLLVKLVALIVNKAATLDPSGMGVEMEANKPNWYDALNGLPGLLGSSISETFEVKRFAQFTLKAIEETGLKDDLTVVIFSELVDFINGFFNLLLTQPDSLTFWNKANSLKEQYRQSIRYGIVGSQGVVTIGRIKAMLTLICKRCDEGIEKAKNKQGLFATYFYHEVRDFEVIEGSNHHGQRHARPKSFKRHDLPLFLEGFVHGLRVLDNPAQALHLHQAVKRSALYDKKLRMYKVCADLSRETEEIGRTRIFPRSWLENETIWLHMEYKYLLELLRRGLAREFYKDIKTCLVPFMKPDVYGRSPLENSSFIVSSAHQDKLLHGAGFVARLSGSTAEFLHIWLIMTVGEKPFVWVNGQLTLALKPLLSKEFFTQKSMGGVKENTFSCRFLAKTLLVYHNPKRKDTFGEDAVRVISMTFTDGQGHQEVVAGQEASGRIAVDVRQGKVARIDVVLG